MTNEEKVTELGKKYQTTCHGIGDCEFEARQAALEMAEWKEQQMIEKGVRVARTCFQRFSWLRLRRLLNRIFQKSDGVIIMTLDEVLRLIHDEEARIEVEINDGTSDYHYLNFWLSDYRSGLDIVKYYQDCTVDNISFLTIERESEITICVKI